MPRPCSDRKPAPQDDFPPTSRMVRPLTRVPCTSLCWSSMSNWSRWAWCDTVAWRASIAWSDHRARVCDPARRRRPSRRRRDRASSRAVAPPHEPVLLYTAEYRIRVVPIAGGLSHPWGMAFRKNGDILVTERDRGTLRIVRDGQLLDQDIPGVPEVFIGTRTAGLDGCGRPPRG